MKAKYRKSGYKSNEVKAFISLFWIYIDSDIKEELVVNRIILLSAL
jgi:hypothetical protein